MSARLQPQPARSRADRVPGVALALSLAWAAAGRAAEVDFAREIRPILAGHCFKCHGPDGEKRKAGLRLDVRDAALQPAKSGARAVVPGDPGASELVRRVFSADEDERMPPPQARLPLTAVEQEALRRWVAAGAEYRAHWAFVKPVRPELPAVRQADWPRTAIDRFSLARMEAAGLAPSPPADPYTLVRRVYLDLVGLPPTPAQADAFVQDPTPAAFERLVDELLASPHYGERWARRWLDLARYADTNGYEKDRPRSIWPYRDWVIRAINAGKPFDAFTVEQLAGDLLAADLPPDDPRRADLIIATGFHRNSMLNEEGGADPQEYRFHSLVDRVHVTAATWLGLTLACAQCHSHKYDPIPQIEYYQFLAFLNNADEPTFDVPQPDQAEKRRLQEEHIGQLEAGLADRFPPELDADWVTPAVAGFKSAAGTRAERQPDGSFLVEGTAPEKDDYTLTLDTTLGGITHLQLLTLPDASLPKNGPGRSENGNFVLSEIAVAIIPAADPTNRRPVKLVRAWADAAQKGFPGWNTIDGKDDTGWAVDTGGDWHLPRALTVEFERRIDLDPGARVQVTLRQQFGKNHLLGRFRLSLGRARFEDRSIAERRQRHLDRRLARWLEAELLRAVDWTSATPATATGNVPTLTIEGGDTVFASGDFTKNDIYTVVFNGDWDGVRALRLEALADDRLPNRGPGRVSYEGPLGDFVLSNLKARAGGRALKIRAATDSHHSAANDAAKAIDEDLQSGWSIDGGQGRDHNAVFVFDQPLEGHGDVTLELQFEHYHAAGLGRFRVWTTRDSNAVAVPHPSAVQAQLLALKRRPPEPERARLLDRLRRYYLTIAPDLAQELAEIDQARRDLPRPPTTLVLVERDADHTRPTHVHKRGDFLQPGELVHPGVPSFLPDLPRDAPRNRLGLARWLVSADNPLTARVVMNREWQAFFGRGLVRTLDDFGFQGELPSHPELLDWLALELVERQWSVKAMHRLIVRSATYQQSSRVTPDRLAADPDNVLLARGPRFRLEAELVRDAALAASGLVSDRVGGPSVYPPQPASVTTEGAYGPLTWTVSTGPDRYRRSLYTFAKRTAPFAMASIFDAPSGESCLARRDRSNTPLQALTLLNDEAFLEMARALGREAAADPRPAAERLRTLFRRCLTRPPTESEVAKLLHFYERQAERFGRRELQATDLLGTADEPNLNLNDAAAWTAVARVLLNLDEAVTRS